MITLVFSVIANLFFGQVTSISGFGGISGIPIPDFLSRTAHPERLYFVTLAVALGLYALLRYVVRTPFGLTLQGIRDDPVRMRSLGYNVAWHRTLAFAFAGLIAAIGGILFVWWNAQIAPSTIGLQATIDVLVIAVIGGLYRLEGAWLGRTGVRRDQQLRAGRRPHLGPVPHAHRRRLPRDRPRLPRRAHGPVGAVHVRSRTTPGGRGHHAGEGLWRAHTRRVTLERVTEEEEGAQDGSRWRRSGPG